MTYQPPPPPPPGPPPPPPQGGQPAGQWGPPPSGPYGAPARGFDPKSVNPLDWAILGIGAVLFIFSFFAYYTFSIGGYSVGPYSTPDYSFSYSAWHFDGGTFIGWFAMIVGLLAAAAVAIQLFVPAANLPMAARVLAVILFAVSLVLYIIGIFAMDVPAGDHGFSYWLSLVLVAAGLVLSLMRAQQTGTALPGPLANMPNIGPRHPGGGPGTPPPPPPGYAPPPPPPGYTPPPAP